MTNIREVLASNLKKYRRKNGFSQDKLAELADISSQYLATVETCRKFPTPEMLERLAQALGIGAHKLFEAPTSPEESLSLLRQDIVNEIGRLTANLERVVASSIKEAFAKECTGKSRADPPTPLPHP
jgi:transcriptional regulator with XRE-family HTH domain